MANEWKYELVGEIADSVSDTHPRDKDELVFLNTSDVLNGKVLHRTYTPVKEWPGQAKKSIQRNDILFSEIRPANGRWAFIDFDAEDFVVSTKLMVIRPRLDKVIPRFLYHFITSELITQWLQHLAESRSGTFPQITFDQVAELEICIPPILTQISIAAFLDNINNKIELNRLMSETLEAMARALFKSWFVDFDPVRAKMEGRDTGLPGHIADLFPSRLVDSELGEIPEGWEVSNIESLSLRVGMGPFGSNIKVSTFVEEGIPVISGQHLNGSILEDRAFNFITTEHAERLKSSNVTRGDVVFTHAGNIGQVSLIPDRSRYERYVLSQRQFFLRCDLTKISPFLVTYFFRSPYGQHKLLANASQVGVPSIARPVSYLKSIILVTPSKILSDRFDSIARRLNYRISIAREEIETLTVIRDSLIPKLISGDLRVKDAEKFVGETV